MKKKMVYMGFAALVVAVSVVYARSGRSNVFTFADHPLAGYADQLPSDYTPVAPSVMEIGGESSTSLLDAPTN